MFSLKFQQTCHKVCHGFSSNFWQTNRIFDDTINIIYDDNTDDVDSNNDNNDHDNNDDSN